MLDVILLLRWEISIRGVLGSLDCLSPWLQKQLIRMRWFRASACYGGVPIIEKGISRGVEVVVADPPKTELFSFVSRVAARLQRNNTEKWMGKVVVPLTRKLDRSARPEHEKKLCLLTRSRRFELRGRRWAFVWPKPLYEFCKGFPVFHNGINDKWFDDHPFLTRRTRVVEVGRPSLPPILIPRIVLRGACSPSGGVFF